MPPGSRPSRMTSGPGSPSSPGPGHRCARGRWWRWRGQRWGREAGTRARTCSLEILTRFRWVMLRRNGNNKFYPRVHHQGCGVSSLFTQIQENNFLLTEDDQRVWLAVPLNQQKIYNFRCQLEASMIFLWKWTLLVLFFCQSNISSPLSSTVFMTETVYLSPWEDLGIPPLRKINWQQMKSTNCPNPNLNTLHLTSSVSLQ